MQRRVEPDYEGDRHDDRHAHQSQYFEIPQRQAGLRRQVGGELAHERGVRAQQGAPGSETAWIGQGVLDEAVQNCRRVV
ncbi:MAG TPA: hypothetical protein VIM25_06700 [Candidatus Limnocylindrales bacterium]